MRLVLPSLLFLTIMTLGAGVASARECRTVDGVCDWFEQRVTAIDQWLSGLGADARELLQNPLGFIVNAIRTFVSKVVLGIWHWLAAMTLGAFVWLGNIVRHVWSILGNALGRIGDMLYAFGRGLFDLPISLYGVVLDMLDNVSAFGPAAPLIAGVVVAGILLSLLAAGFALMRVARQAVNSYTGGFL